MAWCLIAACAPSCGEPEGNDQSESLTGASGSVVGSSESGTTTAPGASSDATTHAESGISSENGLPTSDATGDDDESATATDELGDTSDKQVCGNGVLEGDEECDDGNLVNGDGCSISCKNSAQRWVKKIASSADVHRMVRGNSGQLTILHARLSSTSWRVGEYDDHGEMIRVDPFSHPQLEESVPKDLLVDGDGTRLVVAEHRWSDDAAAVVMAVDANGEVSWVLDDELAGRGLMAAALTEDGALVLAGWRHVLPHSPDEATTNAWIARVEYQEMSANIVWEREFTAPGTFRGARWLAADLAVTPVGDIAIMTGSGRTADEIGLPGQTEVMLLDRLGEPQWKFEDLLFPDELALGEDGLIYYMSGGLISSGHSGSLFICALTSQGEELGCDSSPAASGHEESVIGGELFIDPVWGIAYTEASFDCDGQNSGPDCEPDGQLVRFDAELNYERDPYWSHTGVEPRWSDLAEAVVFDGKGGLKVASKGHLYHFKVPMPPPRAPRR